MARGFWVFSKTENLMKNAERRFNGVRQNYSVLDETLEYAEFVVRERYGETK